MRVAVVLVLLGLAQSPAAAQETPPGPAPGPVPAKPPSDPKSRDGILVRVSPKKGAVLRFRMTDTWTHEEEGVVQGSSEEVFEYTLTVTSASPLGGCEGTLKFTRLRMSGTGPGVVEYDSAKPRPAETPKTNPFDVMNLVWLVALRSATFDVTLSADGSVTAAKGFDAALRTAVAEVAPDTRLPLPEAEEEDVEGSAEVFRDFFPAAPAAPHVPGVEWKSDRGFALAVSEREFAVSSVLTLPEPSRALVTSTYVWKPHPTDEGPGIKTSGGGSVTELYSRTDGLLLRSHMPIHIRSDADAPLRHTRRTVLIERLAANGEPIVPPEPPPSPTRTTPPDPGK